MNTLIVIIGPTGVGKTKVSLQVAKHFNVPVINADSRQLFGDLTIGTAAPTEEQRREVEHLFVGTLALDDYYSAAQYEADVMKYLQGWFADKQDGVALLSGGSMMYVDAVCFGIDDIPTISAEVRSAVLQRLTDGGLEAVLSDLKDRDPEYYAIVDKRNPKRIAHALEVCLMTGKTYTSLRKSKAKERPFRIVRIGLQRERKELYERINQRVLDMVRQGLEEEARRVYPLRHLNSLNTVGYKEMFAYFSGLVSKEEAIRQIQSHTRTYARKQLTWFKRDKTLRWFAPEDVQGILAYLDEVTKTNDSGYEPRKDSDTK